MMNISGVGKAVDVSAVEQVNTSKVSKNCETSAAGPPASADISKPGELFAKLQQLQEQDPAKFKEIVSGIADSLRSAAQQSGSAGGGFLEKLADRFDHAAESGDMSALQPPQNNASGSSGSSVSGHHHHHGHHGGGGSRGAVASILENALTQVDQALTAGASTTPATPAIPASTTTTTDTSPTTDSTPVGGSTST